MHFHLKIALKVLYKNALLEHFIPIPYFELPIYSAGNL